MKRRTKQRTAPYHVTIPVRLMEDFDETLAFNQSRSAKITRLIITELEGEGTRVSDASTKQLFAALSGRDDVDLLMKSLILQVLSQ